ncbi:hypothetical protein TNCV_4118491 [Trichonephila clavipes]|nr:hypothetical protein TNCV_4118491 [Trichonephila clavipes]
MGKDYRSFREAGFSYRAIGARVQRNSSPVRRVWKQWTDEHRINQKTVSGRRKQDNSRTHVAKTVGDFCSAKHMQLLPWPAYSPDISPIEHVGDLVGWCLARNPPPAD